MNTEVMFSSKTDAWANIITSAICILIKTQMAFCNRGGA